MLFPSLPGVHVSFTGVVKQAKWSHGMLAWARGLNLTFLDSLSDFPGAQYIPLGHFKI